MSHKYLKDKKFPKFYYGDTMKKDDHRRPKWKEERKVYGFDERETWDLKGNFLCWLYEHIKMYMEVCSINLEYHTFIYEEKEYTQLEILNKILKDIELYFNIDGCYIQEFGYNLLEFKDNQTSLMIEVSKLWTIVLPAMWW